MGIIYQQGSVFDAPPGSTLVHACNAQGVWGSGVAAEFKRRFPHAFVEYKRSCEQAKEYSYVPTGLYWDVTSSEDQDDRRVVALVTSKGYGAMKDHEATILKATHSAIAQMMYLMPRGVDFHSPRINAGLFAVPWHLTEDIIQSALRVYPENSWTVWTP